MRRFTPRRDRVTILIHVANFHHARGGVRDGLLLSGDRDSVASLQARKNVAFLVFGALAVMGLYHLVLIRVHARDRSTLWFGLVSILMAMRALLTGQPAVLTASSTAGWEALMTLEYFSMYAGVTLFYLYVHALFPRETGRIPLRVMMFVGITLSALTLLAPTRVFSAALYGYHVVVVLGSVYLLIVALRAFRAGRDGTIFFAVGMVILALTVLNDVLYNLGVLPTEYFSGFGMLFFLFFQSLILASRFAADARRVEELLLERTRLEALTFLDDLTGISNRRHFDKTIATEWTRARRHGQPLSIVMTDIDAFKPYNDHYGHLMGDEALSRVARTLHGNLHRSSDLVARYGGEEFALILPSTDREGALIIAETMRAAVEALGIEHAFSDAIPVLTASFGVATAVPDRSAGYDALLHEADKALYQAKQHCKNCVF
jgi:diguanylate cyclase (GGDEF)-like protein